MTNGVGDPPRAEPDPISILRRELKVLHRRSGEPSTRQIARLASNAISHTTVHAVIRCLKRPRWGQLELVVEALGGDIDHFRTLWVNIRNVEDPLDFDTPKRSTSTSSSKGNSASVSHSEISLGSGNAVNELKQEAAARSEVGATKQHGTINVVIASTFGAEMWDVELPIDVKLWQIVDKLAGHRDLPFHSDGDLEKGVLWDLQWEEGGRSFAPSETLRSAGVEPGARLTMRRLK